VSKLKPIEQALLVLASVEQAIEATDATRTAARSQSWIFHAWAV